VGTVAGGVPSQAAGANRQSDQILNNNSPKSTSLKANVAETNNSNSNNHDSPYLRGPHPPAPPMPPPANLTIALLQLSRSGASNASARTLDALAAFADAVARHGADVVSHGMHVPLSRARVRTGRWVGGWVDGWVGMGWETAG
jgi:hypothetical protein